MVHYVYLIGGITHTADSPHARLASVPVGAVTMSPGFWAERMAANQSVGMPALLERFEAHGVLDNFRRLYGASTKAREGYWFTDSDLYKWMEAAAFAGDDALDAVVETVLPAQAADGYLNTAWGDARYENLTMSHELYCAGHFLQAAVAHRRSSGSDVMLDAAVRLADHLCGEFGPGRRDTVDFHPEVEMALVELGRETGTSRYLDLAGALLDRFDGDWRTLPELSGHAVRAAYWCAGLADWVMETGEADGRAALGRLWTSTVETRAYVTGALGGRWAGESVGRAFELPAEGAYAETCSAVALVHWAWRMLSMTGEATYADWLERALYNGLLAGMSRGGDEWFYANPLANAERPEHFPWAFDMTTKTIEEFFPLRRRSWFACTCCPPNVNRTLASLPGYIYGTGPDSVWVHLYAASSMRHAGVELVQETSYPWDGRVTVRVTPADTARELSLFLRIPSWCTRATVAVGGEPWPERPTPGTYLKLRRPWQGEAVTIDFDLDPYLVECNPRVAEYRGSVAVQRGPLVYCLEGVDHDGADVLEAAIDADAPLTTAHRPDLLGGMTVVEAVGSVPTEPWGGLYRRRGAVARSRRVLGLTAIPYYAWANRGPATMTVWTGLSP